MALAYPTAEDMATVRAIDPRDIQKLALRINDYAERAWAALVQAA